MGGPVLFTHVRSKRELRYGAQSKDLLEKTVLATRDGE